MPVHVGTSKAVVSPVASPLRDETAVRWKRLLAASGQILMAADMHVSQQSRQQGCAQALVETAFGAATDQRGQT